MPTVVTEDTFKAEVLNATEPVLVDFWAVWCPPCRALTPLLEEVAKEMKGKAKLVKINVDENQGLSIEYQITSIPTTMIFKNGGVAEIMIGLRPKHEYVELIKKHL